MGETENKESDAAQSQPILSPDLSYGSQEKKHGIFYRRVESSQCLVHAFKNSIFVGIAGGLLAYLLTTNPRKAAFWSWGSYFVSQYPLWYFCNYTERKKEEDADRYEKMLYSKVLLEGTAYEKQLDKMMEEKERHGGINAVSKETQTKDKVKNNEKGQSS